MLSLDLTRLLSAYIRIGAARVAPEARHPTGRRAFSRREIQPGRWNMAQQSGRTTLDNGIKFLRRLIKHPELFFDNGVHDEWQWAVLNACMPYIDHPTYLHQTIVPEFIKFLEDSWLQRKEGKRWTLPLPPKHIFELTPPKRASEWKSKFDGWMEIARNGEFADFKEMQTRWVDAFRDRDKHVLQTFNRLARENSEIKTIFPESSQRKPGRPKGH